MTVRMIRRDGRGQPVGSWRHSSRRPPGVYRIIRGGFFSPLSSELRGASDDWPRPKGPDSTRVFRGQDALGEKAYQMARSPLAILPVRRTARPAVDREIIASRGILGLSPPVAGWSYAFRMNSTATPPESGHQHQPGGIKGQRPSCGAELVAWRRFVTVCLQIALARPRRNRQIPRHSLCLAQKPGRFRAATLFGEHPEGPQ